MMTNLWSLSERHVVFHIFLLNGLKPLPESHDLMKGLATLTGRSTASIRMKMLNFSHLATSGSDGLSNWTKADQKIWQAWIDSRSQDSSNAS